MVTKRDDDYLICRHYYNNIDKINKDYPEFITFKHKDNHYFAWVNDGKVILRSEAYPDYERTVRGIKAILKNRDIHERYSIDSQHGAHFLVLWGGGNHKKHTGGFEKHNEIGRSCPVKDKNELKSLMGFMGLPFLDGVFDNYTMNNPSSLSGKKIATGAATAAAAASLASTPKREPKATKPSSTTSTKATAAATVPPSRTNDRHESNAGGGFKWWWLLPLLLLPLLFFLWKGCDGDTTKKPVTTTINNSAPKNDAATLAAEKERKLEAERLAEEKRVAAEKMERENAAREKAEREKAAREARRRSSNSYKQSGY